MDGDNLLDIDLGLLIKLVQNFPHIYDQRHKNFKNNTLKENTWKKIAATLKTSVEDCMRIWRNLRDKYTREKRLSKDQPQDCPNPSKWEYYDAMKFLNPFIKRRRTLAVRRRSAFKHAISQDNLDYSSEASNSKVWDPTISVKLSPESMSLLEGDFDDGSGDMEEITFETEHLSDSSTRIKETIDQGAVNIVRYQTSEEAFGAYIATRLMEFPPEIRHIKKAKLFKDLEEPENVS